MDTTYNGVLGSNINKLVIGSDNADKSLDDLMNE